MTHPPFPYKKYLFSIPLPRRRRNYRDGWELHQHSLYQVQHLQLCIFWGRRVLRCRPTDAPLLNPITCCFSPAKTDIIIEDCKSLRSFCTWEYQNGRQPTLGLPAALILTIQKTNTTKTTIIFNLILNILLRRSWNRNHDRERRHCLVLMMKSLSMYRLTNSYVLPLLLQRA